jgi:post-segregation antitoxin (ccd killing protein)
MPGRATRVRCYTGDVPNLTITVDAETLRKARVRAVQRGESVNAMLAEALRRYADDLRPGDVFAAIEAVADAHEVGTDSGGRNWTRDDLHRV